MNKANFRRLRIVSIATIAMGLCACTPEPVNSVTAAPIDSVVEAPMVSEAFSSQPVFVSNKRVTSDCGVEFIPVPAPGFADALGRETKQMPPPIEARQAVGAGRELLATDEDRVSSGYILVEPVTVKQSFLINNDKEVVATIKNENYLTYTQLLPNGHRILESPVYSEVFNAGGGKAGCVEEQDAEGNLLWRVNLSSDQYIHHHDVVKLANGNILALIWESEPADKAISQGRNPELVAEDGTFWYDGVIEVNPYTMQIVWEWSTKHHVIQDFDTSQPNYGVVADHPGLFDINRVRTGPGATGLITDWTHMNAIDYNPELDQIALSSYYLSEILVIDHSTTPLESIGHSGGRYGKGGDFLYRWGNPANYKRGSEADRKLFNQHDVQWILPGLPGEGNIMIFNNGNPDVRPYTTVIEFTPEMNSDGGYDLEDGATYGPETLVWKYDPPVEERFFSWFISGAQRLANGNTLVNHGAGGHLREVTSSGDIVWDYSYKDEIDAPHQIFRAYRYAPDHPGLVHLLPNAE